jgi:hypothetical protein
LALLLFLSRRDVRAQLSQQIQKIGSTTLLDKTPVLDAHDIEGQSQDAREFV